MVPKPQKNNEVLDIENKLVVTGGEREEGLYRGRKVRSTNYRYKINYKDILCNMEI